MKKGLTWLMVGIMVTGVMALGWSQGQQQVQRGERGDRGGERGERGQRGGMMLLPPGAYLQVNEQSQEIWTKIGEIQTQMHVKSWELSVLHAEGAGEEQIEAKVAELRELAQEMMAERQNLREHIVMPEGMQGPRDGARGGGAR